MCVCVWGVVRWQACLLPPYSVLSTWARLSLQSCGENAPRITVVDPYIFSQHLEFFFLFDDENHSPVTPRTGLTAPSK